MHRCCRVAMCTICCCFTFLLATTFYSNSLSSLQTETAYVPTNKTTPFLVPCPKRGVVTVIDLGRLGNKIWEYASLWAVGKKLDLDPYAPDSLFKALQKVFQNLTVPSIDTVKHCEKDFVLLYGNMLLKEYIALVRDVVYYQKDLKKEFVYRQEYIEAAVEQFDHVRSLILKKTNEEVTFIGVHVRRTDYIKQIDVLYSSKSAGSMFYLNGMEWFRSRFRNVAFMVTSDDVNWCKENLKGDHGDVFFVNHSGPDDHIYDLTLLSMCNHSLFDYGTYGLWAAIMAGGETVVYDTMNDLYLTEAVRNFPGWHFMT